MTKQGAAAPAAGRRRPAPPRAARQRAAPCARTIDVGSTTRSRSQCAERSRAAPRPASVPPAPPPPARAVPMLARRSARAVLKAEALEAMAAVAAMASACMEAVLSQPRCCWSRQHRRRQWRQATTGRIPPRDLAMQHDRVVDETRWRRARRLGDEVRDHSCTRSHSSHCPLTHPSAGGGSKKKASRALVVPADCPRPRASPSWCAPPPTTRLGARPPACEPAWLARVRMCCARSRQVFTVSLVT